MVGSFKIIAAKSASTELSLLPIMVPPGNLNFLRSTELCVLRKSGDRSLAANVKLLRDRRSRRPWAPLDGDAARQKRHGIAIKTARPLSMIRLLVPVRDGS